MNDQTLKTISSLSRLPFIVVDTWNCHVVIGEKVLQSCALYLLRCSSTRYCTKKCHAWDVGVVILQGCTRILMLFEVNKVFITNWVSNVPSTQWVRLRLVVYLPLEHNWWFTWLTNDHSIVVKAMLNYCRILNQHFLSRSQSYSVASKVNHLSTAPKILKLTTYIDIGLDIYSTADVALNKLISPRSSIKMVCFSQSFYSLCTYITTKVCWQMICTTSFSKTNNNKHPRK